MKLIVGIGNPGKQYIETRHNIGFQILDKFCNKYNIKFKPAKSNFWYLESILNTFHFFLVKPTTYVNNSGLIVKELIDKFEIPLKNLLVIYDDTNLEIGMLRIRKSGSDGGHNGIKSIIYHLENDKFNRMRIGVGKPQDNLNLADFVLSNFSDKDKLILDSKTDFIIQLIEEFIIGGMSNLLDYYSKNLHIKTSTIS